MIIKLVKGDITKIKADAIVNSANETLLGDDGVDGAIHQAAGSELRAYCETLGGCEVGEVKVTPSFNLPYEYIFHTVGPQYGNEHGKESDFLRQCYLKCLKIADELNISSLAFPSISTGQYGYPIADAALIALSTINEYRKVNRNLTEVSIVLFDSDDFNDEQRDDYLEYQKVYDSI